MELEANHMLPKRGEKVLLDIRIRNGQVEVRISAVMFLLLAIVLWPWFARQILSISVVTLFLDALHISDLAAYSIILVVGWSWLIRAQLQTILARAWAKGEKTISHLSLKQMARPLFAMLIEQDWPEALLLIWLHSGRSWPR